MNELQELLRAESFQQETEKEKEREKETEEEEQGNKGERWSGEFKIAGRGAQVTRRGETSEATTAGKGKMAPPAIPSGVLKGKGKGKRKGGVIDEPDGGAVIRDFDDDDDEDDDEEERERKSIELDRARQSIILALNQGKALKEPLPLSLVVRQIPLPLLPCHSKRD